MALGTHQETVSMSAFQPSDASEGRRDCIDCTARVARARYRIHLKTTPHDCLTLPQPLSHQPSSRHLRHFRRGSGHERRGAAKSGVPGTSSFPTRSPLVRVSSLENTQTKDEVSFFPHLIESKSNLSPPSLTYSALTPRTATRTPRTEVR